MSDYYGKSLLEGVWGPWRLGEAAREAIHRTWLNTFGDVLEGPMTEQEWLTSEDYAEMLGYLIGIASTTTARRPAPFPLTDRKSRLFACACCRQVEQHMDDPILECLRLIEEQADRELTTDEHGRREAAVQFRQETYSYPSQHGHKVDPTRWNAADAVLMLDDEVGIGMPNRMLQILKAINRCLVRASGREPLTVAEWESAVPPMTWACNLLRDIFGNPFRPVKLRKQVAIHSYGAYRRGEPADGVQDYGPFPDWLTETVHRLAAAIYDNRDWAAMPALADALEEAGCREEAVLRHLRSTCHACTDKSGFCWGLVADCHTCHGTGRATHVRGCWVIDLVLGKE